MRSMYTSPWSVHMEPNAAAGARRETITARKSMARLRRLVDRCPAHKSMHKS